jgi:hypothetical protein
LGSQPSCKSCRQETKRPGARIDVEALERDIEKDLADYSSAPRTSRPAADDADSGGRPA